MQRTAVGRVYVKISKQSVPILLLVGVAFGAIVLGAIYQGDRSAGEARVIGETDDTVAEQPSQGGRVIDPDGAATQSRESEDVDPIEAFLPSSPTGANCREPVGVDLIPGYAATLVINGKRIPPEEMNGADPTTGAIPAGRTQGRYTFGPEENCPNGEFLRPRDNTLQACVYKVEEGPESCAVSQFTFDAL